MAQGLLIWDANGRIVMDTSTRCGRILGVGNTGLADGSITPAGADQGDLWVVTIPSHNNYNQYDRPKFTITGNTISWTWTAGAASERIAYEFYYGVR